MRNQQNVNGILSMSHKSTSKQSFNQTNWRIENIFEMRPIRTNGWKATNAFLTSNDYYICKMKLKKTKGNDAENYL